MKSKAMGWETLRKHLGDKSLSLLAT